jgi:predicted transcriptional regulator
MLVEDGQVLLEIPLSARSWDRRSLEREFEYFERDLDRMSRLFNTFSNANRMRMMRAVFEREKSIAFTELMKELDMNPKLIWESTRKLSRVGLIEKDDHGRYRTTREGEAQFLMASIALRKLFELLDEI